MEVISDLHIHSKYSRAVSKEMTIPNISTWANKKGIDLVGTSDWTHPVWYRELLSDLSEVDSGVYKSKEVGGDTHFILSTEISSIYKQDGKSRRVHTLVFAPNLGVVEKINKELLRRGANLLSDGRPILGLSAYDITEIVLGVDEKCLVIPAHIWTPWFSMYGSQSGFDSIGECFGEFEKYIYAVETGLSSDPAMNWRISELNGRQIVSSSDAHSYRKLGREATVFELEKITYDSFREAIMGSGKGKITYTIEFYPEEGKYHYTGHRKCDVIYSPKEMRKMGSICPVCGKPLTIGVMSRVESLSNVDIEVITKRDKFGVNWVEDKRGERPSYVMIVPLAEILSEVLGVGPQTKKVEENYNMLINEFDSEFKVLLKTQMKDIERVGGERLSNAIKRVRAQDISIKPGYDGVFGEVSIWKGKEKETVGKSLQSTLF